MSGSITTGIDYSLLFTSTSSNKGIAGSLLSTIYGSAATVTNTGAGALAALQNAETNQTKDIAAEAKQPQVAKDIAAFQSALATAKTPAQLLQNPAALKVLLTANGLGSQTAYPLLAQKVLLSDPTKSNSLVNQVNVTNSSWLPAVQTYQFATKGLAVLQDPKIQATLTSAYAEVAWRQSLDATTPGLSNALTFLQQAPTVKAAVDILGSSALRTVVTTALGIPEQIAFQPLEAQERAITDKLDVTRLADPKFAQSLAQQYLLNNASSSSAGPPSLDQLAVQAAGLVV